jgi:hypothetical protein
MKCQQSGNCNVCEDAIAVANKTLEKRPENVQKVKTDLKLMISTDVKLSRCEDVENNVVSSGRCYQHS